MKTHLKIFRKKREREKERKRKKEKEKKKKEKKEKKNAILEGLTVATLREVKCKADPCLWQEASPLWPQRHPSRIESIPETLWVSIRY